MPGQHYPTQNWKIFWVIFFSIISLVFSQEIFYFSRLAPNQIDFTFDPSSLALSTSSIIYHSYNLVYYKIFQIPVVFWLLIVINLFLIYSLKLENLSNLSHSLFAAFKQSEFKTTKEKYLDFNNFICSSYGAVSIAAVSEIAILLKNYNTIGSIFWMCLTILLVGLIQLSEIILNCHYVENDNQGNSCFICVLQYVGSQYSKHFRTKKAKERITFLIGLYGICMILVSFFSATLFQIEQAANVFIMSGGDYSSIIGSIGFVLLFFFFISSFNSFKMTLRVNNKIIIPMILSYMAMSVLFLFLNPLHLINSVTLIFENIWDPVAILPGITSGLVISFARYVYRKSDDNNDENSSIYEDTDLIKARVMYTTESFFMMFLVVISGLVMFISKNFNYFFFGLDVNFLIAIFLVFFGVSVIFNEAIYSRIVLIHILDTEKVVLNWIIRLVLLCGVFFGLFQETDHWVDVADHISIIFFVFNIASFLFLKRETRMINKIESYKFTV
jgi:Na+/alanine symporter